MFRPLSLCIGLRYIRAKRRQRFISFISLISMVGIALGVMVLITVLSVINGFDYEIKQRFFSVAPQVTVNTLSDISKDWQEMSEELVNLPQVSAVAPYVAGNGMVAYGGKVSALNIVGILPNEEKKISVLGDKIVAGTLNNLKPESFGLVLGKNIADKLGVTVGDSVLLFTSQTTVTPLGILPRYKRFRISGIFSIGEGFLFDDTIGYINMTDASRLFPPEQNIRGFHLILNNIYQAPAVAAELQAELPYGYWVTDWTQQFGAFFQALAMEKTMMFVILLFIIAVATFNLVATLVMGVNDKESDIAILRTLGATRNRVMSIFIIQGAVTGLIGTLMGIIGGVILSLNATALVNMIQSYFHVQFISSSVYFVNFLPSRLEWLDLLRVGGLAFFLSLLATIYPAWRSFKIQPAEALRYE